jgi:hypothetical protein
MSEPRPSSISRFLAFTVGAVWYLIILGIIVTMGFWMAAMLGWISAQGEILFPLPIKVEYKESAFIASSPAEENLPPVKIKGHTDVVIAEAFSKGKVSFLAICVMLPFLFIALLIARQLRLFLRSVKEGRPFERENPKRIRLIGYLVILFGIICTIWGFVMSFNYIHKISLPGTSLKVNPDFNLSYILLGLLILLIAQIFDAGVKLQEEHDLTI